MLNFLRKVIGKITGVVFEADIEKLKTNAREIYNMDSMGGGFWGNSIKISYAPEKMISGTVFRVVGWKSNRPQKGDLLRMRMASGKVSISKFTKVDLCNDPADMFFGDVRMIGYDLNYDKS